MKIAGLKDSKHFIKIWDSTHIYYGADQKWFDMKIAKKTACGTVAAANITAYMSRSKRENYANLYAYEDFSIDNFKKHMQDIYAVLAPWRIPGTQIGLGIWPIDKMKKGVEGFANARGVQLQAVKHPLAFTKDNVIDYIIMGLNGDAPIAMLIDFNRQLEPYEAHWVVITELIKDAATLKYYVNVSTWGKSALIDIDAYIEGATTYQGLLFFN